MTWEEDLIQELRELQTINRQHLEILGLEFAFDPLRYIARKLRTGEAEWLGGRFYQLVAAGATFTITLTNPTGYVWIPIFQSVDVSQNAVFELAAWVDDLLFPPLHLPRLSSFEFKWTETLPFGFIVKETATYICINHDIAAQWISTLTLGINLRKDVWERDSRLMDEAAERYVQPLWHWLPKP